MKIIVNNFFEGILERGIPIYTKELSLALGKNENVESVIVIKSPLWSKKLPRFFLNILFLFYEQIYIPIYARVSGADTVIYPYNSGSLIDIFFGKGVVVIHDLISLKQKNTSFSALYVRACILFASKYSMQYFYISESTKKVIDRLKLFSGKKSCFLPNPFLSFEKLVMESDFIIGDYILLITGVGENKDLSRALNYYLNSIQLNKLPLKVLGCGSNLDYAFNLLGGAITDDIEFLPTISDLEVVSLYRKSNFVWVHSNHEGYGRAIAEAKISEKRVLCSAIPPFVEQIDSGVFTYNNSSQEELGKAIIKLKNYNARVTRDKSIENQTFLKNLNDLFIK